MNKYIFPVTLIILDLLAGLVYGINGDFKKTYILDCGSGLKYYGYVLGGFI